MSENKGMKTLIAEDDKVTRVILERLLTRWGFEIRSVADGVEALEEMEQPDPPRLILMDWDMPKIDGLEVCRRLREIETSDPPYIIFLTAKESPGDIARALDAGASDCLRKPCDRSELLARIRAGERTLKLQMELNQARQEMTKLAMYDSLTEIYNRRAVTERLDQELARAKRTCASVCVGIADLDHFKAINDTRGHRAGDLAITTFAKEVQATMRASDVIGRWGGEEFLIIAPTGNGAERNTLFERIRLRTRNLVIPDPRGDIRVTVSMGVAVAFPGETGENLLHRADLALYEAKKQGRDRVCFAATPEALREDVPVVSASVSLPLSVER